MRVEDLSGFRMRLTPPALVAILQVQQRKRSPRTLRRACGLRGGQALARAATRWAAVRVPEPARDVPPLLCRAEAERASAVPALTHVPRLGMSRWIGDAFPA